MGSNEPLFDRVQEFCSSRGWQAKLLARDTPEPRHNVVVRVCQGDGYSMSSFGATTNQAIQRMARLLNEHGFEFDA